MVFNIFRRPTSGESPIWRICVSDEEIVLRRDGEGRSVESPLLQGFVAQLIDDGLVVEADGEFTLSWDNFFAALELPDNAELPQLLGLPAFTSLDPTLLSRGALSDRDFSISIGGWMPREGLAQTLAIHGGLLRQGQEQWLMRAEQWPLVHEVIRFAHRGEEERTDQAHRVAWGRIRGLATKAGAYLDSFLDRTVVLTPERLDLALRRSEPVSGDTVVEISPSFEGAPTDWLERFDARKDVPDRYDIPTERGIVQVLVTPQVKTVLQEIKRMPGRRVAGSRAEAFVLNPYATLGPDAKAVIDEDLFDAAREDAGLQYEHFTPKFERDGSGYPVKVGLLIESASTDGPALSHIEWLDDESLGAFVHALESAISGNRQLLAWRGFDLEIQGETPRHLEQLKAAVEQRRTRPPVISWEQVYDLSSYSDRIGGIGEENPYYSPYIAKKDDEAGWFPENVDQYMAYRPPGESDVLLIPTNDEFLACLNQKIERARGQGAESVEVPGLPRHLTLAEAEKIVRTFRHVDRDLQQGEFDPGEASKPPQAPGQTKPSLILLPNIQQLDYEVRREALLGVLHEADIPQGLHDDFQLLPHQREGLAWLQHLYRSRVDHQVRGCVLADDMGLGKTFQLLAFMAWRLEHDPDAPPMLVVAPVSLLENWKEEAGKFLKPGVLPILTAHGESLVDLRVPKNEIDARLREDEGLVKFLKPDWVGEAKLVLTTYETLRDLEFTFAAQPWSVMVCDEAQKIKNPAAMVTRAAKKQNVGFKIACTGTPVENTLADLWCLFDFIQPGLLGALDDFGRRYRKPIEAKNDEECARVEELRERIAPQILRRTKAEVARDLPSKIEDSACRHLKLSSVQRVLYGKAVDDFKRRNQPGAAVPFKNHLGLLHYLRMICTDPRMRGLTAATTESLTDYRQKAPKLDWLMEQLSQIQQQGEKAIVFCEFRDIQRLLQHYINVVFKYKADIINGDTTTAGSRADNRQRRIKAFQERAGFGVIILSPVAVGFGVNIQAANHVVHYTRTWNPAKEDQATDRAYRIGQTKDVFVYYPVVEAEDFITFDVKLDQLLSRKRELATDMLNGSGDLGSRDFDIEDVVPPGKVDGMNPRIDIETTNSMDGRYFEGLVAALWAKQGHGMVQVTPSAGDHGVDVVVIADGMGMLVQAKQSTRDDARLGWDAIRDVVGGEAHYRRRFPNIEFQKYVITNQRFNRDAHAQAEENGVLLIERPKLEELLEAHPIHMTDVESQLHGVP